MNADVDVYDVLLQSYPTTLRDNEKLLRPVIERVRFGCGDMGVGGSFIHLQSRIMALDCFPAERARNPERKRVMEWRSWL